MQKKELLNFKHKNNNTAKVITLIITILLTLNIGSAIGILVPNTTTPTSTPKRNIQWNVTMNFTEPSGQSAYVIFGEATDANDGPPADSYDRGLPPPPPQDPYIRSWFNDDLPVPYNELWHDYRHYNTSNVHKQWNMTVEWANGTGGGTDMTMSWNTTEFTGCEYISVILMRKGQLNATWYIVADMLFENNFSWSHEYYYLDPPGIYIWFLTDEFKINATSVNAPPVAYDDFYDTDEDIILNVTTGEGVLQNDTDDDGDPLTAVKESDPSHGILTMFNTDGSFVYEPNPDFNGNDSFTYKAYDGYNYSDIATVTITINPVNDDPIAINDTAITSENTAVTIDVLDNDYDIDSDTLFLESFNATSAEGGTITRDDNGTSGDTSDDKLVFTPFLDFFSPPDDTFEYSISDGNGATDTGSVTITVTSENNPPTSANNTVTTLEDIAYTFIEGDFPFTDVDGDSLSHVKITVLESVGDLTWDGVSVSVDDEIPVADIAAGKLVFTPVLNGNWCWL
jgi:VCBS repeat-containing protein